MRVGWWVVGGSKAREQVEARQLQDTAMSLLAQLRCCRSKPRKASLASLPHPTPTRSACSLLCVPSPLLPFLPWWLQIVQGTK